jgi:hypothetical protein
VISPPPLQGETTSKLNRFSAAWQSWFSAIQAVLQGVSNYGVDSTQTLATGFSVQFPQDTGILLIKSAGVLASGTVTLPANPVNHQQVTIATTGGITSFSVQAVSGQSVSNTPSSLGAGAAVSYWFSSADSAWYVISSGVAGAGGSGVTSVGLALPASLFTVSGSPVTGSGSLTGFFKNQPKNLVFAGPAAGSDAAPALRALVAADLTGLVPVVPVYLRSQDGSVFLTQGGLELVLD